MPSIIYGMWGLFVLRAAVRPLRAGAVSNSVVEGMPIVGTILYSQVPSGIGILTAGIILALMIIPFIASITRDMLDQIPTVLRESAYGIGCTTWEVVRHVLVPQAGVSIIGAIMLGLGRALGETMAVTFVVGNANRLSGLDLRSRLDDRLAHRQRVQRGARHAAQRADRARLHPVPRHLRRPRRRAHPRLAREGALSGCLRLDAAPAPDPTAGRVPGAACGARAGSPTAP